MKKHFLMVLLCVATAGVTLFTGCGSDKQVADTQTSGAPSANDTETTNDTQTADDTKSNSFAITDSYANIEAMLADEEIKAELDAQYASLSNKDIVMEVDGKENQLIVTANCLEYEYSADVAAAFEQTLDGVADAMVSQANKLTSHVEDPNVSILVQYVDKNGEVLASRTFYAE